MQPFFSILMCLGWLRSDPLEEILGLDCRYSRHIADRGDVDDVADDSCIHDSNAFRRRGALEHGKTNGRYLREANRAFKRRLNDSYVVNFDGLTSICESEDHTEVYDSNETAPSSTVISDPSRREDVAGQPRDSAIPDGPAANDPYSSA